MSLPQAPASKAHATYAAVKNRVAPPKRLIVETRYYQNASKAGGSALAEYPEVRVRYGVMQNVEMFYDASSEIAVSGTHGNGIYYMTHPGWGTKLRLGGSNNAEYSLTAESHPPLDPMANLYLIPMSDVHIGGFFQDYRHNAYYAEAGYLNFQTQALHTDNASFFSDISETHDISRQTSVTAELRYQSHAVYRSRGQTSAMFGMHQSLNTSLMGYVELGTSFNVVGNSKPHYLGFGFLIH